MTRKTGSGTAWNPRRSPRFRDAVWVCLALVLAASARDLTFFHVSDTHYGLSEPGDRAMTVLVDVMNALPGTAYPTNLGGVVARPRGVIHTGDMTNDGKAGQWAAFVRDFGLLGGDGRLAWPVYETFGNHDGGSNRPVRIAIRERNLRRRDVTAVSSNGIHYAWSWDGVRFICCGISPGTRATTYDPEESLAFLAGELARPDPTGAPVVLLHHFGFDEGHSLRWWPDAWRTDLRRTIARHNVVAILHGHAHETLIYRWAGYDVYHPPHFRQKQPKTTGAVSHGFFVVRITDDEFTVAERRLDGTWGMTARKPLANAPPARGTEDP
jgi:cytolysin (calcineurin-like family phosphatase)